MCLCVSMYLCIYIYVFTYMYINIYRVEEWEERLRQPCRPPARTWRNRRSCKGIHSFEKEKATFTKGITPVIFVC